MTGRTRGHRLKRLVAVLFGAALAVGLAGLPAGASGCGDGPRPDGELRSIEQQLLSLANGSRGSSGALASHGSLTQTARDHAARMAAVGRIYHNDAFMASIGSLGASMLAENVGMGCSAPDLHGAFMASPSHRANIVNGGLTHAGFGAATNGTGTVFVVQAFATFPGAAAPAPAPAAAAAPPPPAATAPPAPPPPAAAAPPAPPAGAVQPEVQAAVPAPGTPEPVNATPRPIAAGHDLTLQHRAGLAAPAPAMTLGVASTGTAIQAVSSTLDDAALPGIAVMTLLVALFVAVAAGRRREASWGLSR